MFKIAQNKAFKEQIKYNMDNNKKGFESKVRRDVDNVKMEKKE